MSSTLFAAALTLASLGAAQGDRRLALPFRGRWTPCLGMSVWLSTHETQI